MSQCATLAHVGRMFHFICVFEFFETLCFATGYVLADSSFCSLGTTIAYL